MFCKKDKCDKCGLYVTRPYKQGLHGEPVMKTMCIFEHILNSQLRMETGNIRIQAATESTRNENVRTGRNVYETIATGFMGMLFAVREDWKGFERMMKRINRTMAKMGEEENGQIGHRHKSSHESIGRGTNTEDVRSVRRSE